MANKRVTYKISITWNDWKPETEDIDTHDFFKDKLDDIVEQMDGEVDDFVVTEHN